MGQTPPKLLLQRASRCCFAVEIQPGAVSARPFSGTQHLQWLSKLVVAPPPVLPVLSGRDQVHRLLQNQLRPVHERRWPRKYNAITAIPWLLSAEIRCGHEMQGVISGGLVGAGTGAIIGAIAGGGHGAGIGAAVGGGLGAVAGAASTPAPPAAGVLPAPLRSPHPAPVLRRRLSRTAFRGLRPAALRTCPPRVSGAHPPGEPPRP